MARFPFVVAIAYTRDETNHMADILLPDATDLESLQLIRIGGSKYIEQFWEHEGYALRQPVVDAAGRGARFHRHRHRARAPHRPAGAIQRLDQPRRRRRAAQGRRTGIFPSTRTHAIRPRRNLGRRVPAASAELTDGKETHDLDWWKEHGLRTKPFPHSDWYLFPTLAAQGLRFELPYQERL